MKTPERLQAREMRRAGASIREIERELQVSRSTASRWVADIRLTDQQKRALIGRVTMGQLVAAERKAARAREQRAKYQDEGRELARTRGKSYAAGCMLYWAEGEKCRSRVAMSNSDPALLTFFGDFLREHFDVPCDSMTVYCNLFADHLERQLEIESFWLETLRLPQTSLRKSVVNCYSKYSQKKRSNMLPYGTCKLVVHSTRIVQMIFGSIQEYAGIDRPEWLY